MSQAQAKEPTLIEMLSKCTATVEEIIETLDHVLKPAERTAPPISSDSKEPSVELFQGRMITIRRDIQDLDGRLHVVLGRVQGIERRL